jgi:hypothetical protein
MLTRYIRQRRSELLDAGRAVTAPHRQRDVSRLEAFPRRIAITALSLLSALLFWGRAVTQLHLRHPHEDAFILFRYAQHLAKGDGIVFNIGGPHAEGATDFLWMILLALGVKASIDIALVAASLNACGAGIITWGLLRLFLGERSIRATDLAFSIFIALTTPFIAGSHASIDGFSTEVYCALVILGYQCCVSEQLRPLLLTPYLAILLGLFRPDGLLIGATQVCVALFASYLGMHSGNWRPMLQSLPGRATPHTSTTEDRPGKLASSTSIAPWRLRHCAALLTRTFVLPSSYSIL